MLSRLSSAMFAGLLLMSHTGCDIFASAPDPSVGGLKTSDFRLISLNGFESEDHAADRNDYAWSMAYFQPDGSDEGHIYVGTGNDMLGLMFRGMAAMFGGGDLEDVAVFPPEIRRYRGDIFGVAWEKVFDYRNVETAPNFETIGFRYLTSYRAQSDNVNYLYAATFGEEATIWRTATGEAGSWEKAWSSGGIGSVRMMAEHNGVLYLALANDAPEGERIAKIWATDGADFWPVVEDGFGDENNFGMASVISYNNYLYAGTMNLVDGYQIWKLEGPDEGTAPQLIVGNGGPSPVNESAITPCIFQGKLYFGNMIYHMTSIMNGLKGSDIIRISQDDTWESVIGPDGIGGYGSGFNHWPNTYIWSMCVHGEWMYAGTYDQVTSLSAMLDAINGMVAGFMPFKSTHADDGALAAEDTLMLDAAAKAASPTEVLFHGGADMYKTQDGVTWHPVTLDGLGDVGNYGFRTMVSADGRFYVGTANPYDGLEIWCGRSSD